MTPFPHTLHMDQIFFRYKCRSVCQGLKYLYSWSPSSPSMQAASHFARGADRGEEGHTIHTPFRPGPRPRFRPRLMDHRRTVIFPDFRFRGGVEWLPSGDLSAPPPHGPSPRRGGIRSGRATRFRPMCFPTIPSRYHHPSPSIHGSTPPPSPPHPSPPGAVTPAGRGSGPKSGCGWEGAFRTASWAAVAPPPLPKAGGSVVGGSGGGGAGRETCPPDMQK